MIPKDELILLSDIADTLETDVPHNEAGRVKLAACCKAIRAFIKRNMTQSRHRPGASKRLKRELALLSQSSLRRSTVGKGPGCCSPQSRPTPQNREENDNDRF